MTEETVLQQKPFTKFFPIVSLYTLLYLAEQPKISSENYLFFTNEWIIYSE